MAENPQFTSQPNNGLLALTDASLSGTRAGTNSVNILTAGTLGTRINKLIIKNSSDTPTANAVRLFLTSGGITTLIGEYAIDSTAHASPSEGFSREVVFNDLIIESGDTIECNIHAVPAAGEIVSVTLLGGNF